MTARKIQAEVDRTLKRIQEGIDDFDALWVKVHEATSQVQKERQETDLKKEIKKLQRQREQIKAWQVSSEIKDKQQINEARRLIESKMEAFKVCERETKTKAFSKEGLALPDRSDPQEIAKAHTIAWINQCIQLIGDRIAELEIESETNNARKKKVISKGELSPDVQLDRHKWHTLKLEQILRMLDNGEIQPSDVDDIREDVEEYVNSRGDLPNIDDESLYDTLELPAIESLGLSPIASALSIKEKPLEEDTAKDTKVIKEEKKKDTACKGKIDNTTLKATSDAVSTYQPAVVKVLAEPTSGIAKIALETKEPSETSPVDPSVDPMTVSQKAEKSSRAQEAIDRTAQPGPVSTPSQLLQISFQNLPTPGSCEFQALHAPLSPVQTPPSYPQSRLESLNSFDRYAKFDLDTLFFIFYYEQGTYRQYLAIAELNRRGWKFDPSATRWSTNDSTWEWENAWGLVQS